MNMLRKFRLEAGFDCSITLQIDTAIMTEELAKLVNEFWSDSVEVYAASNGDSIEAVARQAAPFLLVSLSQGYNKYGACAELAQQEGWPEKHGISICDYVSPDLDSASLDVEELAV